MHFPEDLEDSPFNKNPFFLHEMDKLSVVLMSIKWLNKIEPPLIVNANST